MRNRSQAFSGCCPLRPRDATLSTALRDTPARIAPPHSLRGPSARSGRMPREALDAPEDLPKQAARQAAVGQLEAKVLRIRPRRPPGCRRSSAAPALLAAEPRGLGLEALPGRVR